jgi:cation:H+ antiporter
MLPVNELLPWLFVFGGIVLLGWGASWLVDGASRLALRLGVSPFVVGLTVVGFGTSMPEFTVSVLAASRGSGGLSLGNAVGSNIMNLLLVLGVAAVIAPIAVLGARRILWRDLLYGLVPAAILMATAWDGVIEGHWALVLVIVFAAFIITCVVQARNQSKTPAVVGGHTLRHLAWTVIGIAILVTGSELMVRGGVDLARSFGVSEAVIGLTLVALGTSLPELATSVAAAAKGQSEISVGNVLGSNVFNLGLIVGTAFLIRPGAVPAFVIHQDIPFLIAATLLVGLVVLRDGKISRGEGVGMLVFFAAYVAYVVVRGG